jgi:hypothetical protein
MGRELAKVGISAERTRGKLPKEFDLTNSKFQVMKNRTPGAIPCWEGQVEIMKEGLRQNKNTIVFEDDLLFCSDWPDRISYIENWLNTHEWDVFWLSGTFSVNPPYWHTGNNPELPGSYLGKDAECTDDPHIMRTFGCFCTFAYILNVRSIPTILSMLDEIQYMAMGIDFAFIKLSTQMKQFSYVPGCIIQIDNLSDIGQGVTKFSNFLKLNGTLENSAYVFQDKLTDFDPTTFEWAECKIAKP